MDPEKYRKLFLEESREHLRALGDGFMGLERDARDLAAVDELFRHAHSMKGMASSMGYDPITMLSHAMEDVLGMLKKRELEAAGATVDLLLAALDRVEKMVGEVEAAGSVAAGGEELVESLRALGKGAQAPAAPVPQPEEALEEVVPEEEVPLDVPLPGSSVPPRAAVLMSELEPGRRGLLADFAASGLKPFFVQVAVDRESSALAARDFIILSRMAKAGVVVASSPDIEEVRRGRASALVESVLLYGDSRPELERLLGGIPEIKGVSAVPLPPELLRAAGALTAPEATAQARGAARSQTVRVDTSVLDRLINIVGEMLVSHERLSHLASVRGDEEAADELEGLGGLVNRFQEAIMEVRMMPLDLVAARFPRMVRDLCHKAGKECRYEVEGMDIELDRSILEEIGEALIHLLRNAVDHGLETPAEREAAGKPREGVVSFRARREKEWVYIEIGDDGRGINLDAVRAKALETGLVSGEALDTMDREEVMMLTSLPGFTTAREVTDVSGRGVGLDAVKARVEAMGGNISLRSTPGQGTTVSLKLPLSLAIIRVLVVSADGRLYGLPVTRVQHTVELEEGLIRRAGSQEYFRDGRALVALRRLGGLLETSDGGEKARKGPVVVVEKGRRRYGLLVDDIMGLRDAVIKPLGQPLMRVPALTGAAIMGDGLPLILIDVLRLL